MDISPREKRGVAPLRQMVDAITLCLNYIEILLEKF